jgi:asparagine synthase (glutamine-hydrolysing)
MVGSIKHRGPDDEGYLLITASGHHICLGDDTPDFDYESHSFAKYLPEKHIANAYDMASAMAFGHRRLSILDLSILGHQPMSYLDRYWIVHNGEVYNFVELRQTLERAGYSFVSNTDTEVIMAAYDRWGSECLNKFNGMWAFVIYDSEKDILFISRDRFGIKPLYYYKGDSKHIFASEIRAIIQHKDVMPSPNIEFCKKYIRDGGNDGYAKETAFKDIFRFDIASYVETTISELSKADIKEQKFWDIRPNLSTERFDEQRANKYARQYRDLLSDAVRIRLRSDVKVGSALSGGLDSSSIVYFVNCHLREQKQEEKQETFSSVFKSKGVTYCDESRFIDKLVRRFNIHSNQIEPQAEEVLDEHAKTVSAMEEPTGGLNVGGWHTYKLVGNSDVKVTLDGQGPDEMLGGYTHYLYMFFVNLELSRIWRECKAFSRMPGVGRKWILLAIGINILRRIIGKRAVVSIMKRLGVGEPDSHFLRFNEVLYRDTMQGLVRLLHYGDSQSMAHSIESRFPYLDYRLVEFLASVPAVYKVYNGWTKYLARMAMDHILPDSITWRKDKMGWPDPADYWIRGDLKESFCQKIESSRFLRQLGVGYDVRKRIETNEPVNNLVRLFNLSVWYDTFFPHAEKSQRN